MLMKEILKDTQNEKKYCFFMDQKYQYHENATLLKVLYRVNAATIKRIRKTITK